MGIMTRIYHVPLPTLVMTMFYCPLQIRVARGQYQRRADMGCWKCGRIRDHLGNLGRRHGGGART